MAAAGKLLRHQKESLLHGPHGTFSRKGGGTWLEVDGAAWLYGCQETGSRRIGTKPSPFYFFFSWLICPDYPLSQLIACW